MRKRHDENSVYSLVLPLALFFLLIISASADGTSPGDSGAGIMTLGGPCATNVSITAPDDIDNWEMSPFGTGVNIQVGRLQVKADGDWQVTAEDKDATTSGHMTEWYDGSYISTPEQLDSVMSISVASGGSVDTGYEKALPAGGLIAKGPTTNNVFNDVPITFKQPVSWGDKVLTGGHTYKIVVTFTISPYG